MASDGVRAVLCMAGLALATAVATQAPTQVNLSVAGRASANVQLAAAGARVAAAWGARLPGGATDVYLATSGDGGRSFSAPVRVNDRAGVARINGETPPDVAFVARPGQPPAIDVLWIARDAATTVRVSRSLDGGRTFAASRELQAGGAAGDRGWATMTSDAGGGTHAVWLDHRAMAAARAAAAAHQHMAAPPAGGPAPVAAAPTGSSLYYSNGTTEREIAKGVCYCCKTAVAAGPRGAIYSAWRHVYPGNYRDIAFTMSPDGGRTFTPAARVSEDGWQLDGCPEDGPALSVDSSGTAHLVWPTIVSYGQQAPHKALFYASTKDGRSFSPRMQVSPSPRNIAHPQLVVGQRPGEMAVFWDEIVGGRQQVFVSRRAPEGRFVLPEPISGSSTAAYPAAVFADNGMVVAWTDGMGQGARIVVRRLAGSGP